MTCREKLLERYGALDKKIVDEIITEGCPDDFGLRGDPEDCRPFTSMCDECWDRECPENAKCEPADNATMLMVERAMLKYAKPTNDVACGTIKDSGDRTEFESGAVRDMREGKGRCDLLPLEVVSRFVGDDGKDEILDSIVEFQKTNNTDYLYNALAYFETKSWDCPYTLCLEVAKHFEEGAKKYGDDNWRRGIPVYCYIDSAVRHYLKWLRGDKDEFHDRAFVWNLMCCIWEVDYHKKESE